MPVQLIMMRLMESCIELCARLATRQRDNRIELEDVSVLEAQPKTAFFAQS